MSVRSFTTKKEQTNKTRQYLERLNMKIESNQLYLQDRNPELFQKSLPPADKFIKSDSDIVKYTQNATSVAQNLLEPITDPLKVQNIIDRLNKEGYLDLFNQHFAGIMSGIKKRYTTITADTFLQETIKYIKGNVITKTLDDKAQERLEKELEDLDIEERKQLIAGQNLLSIQPKDAQFFSDPEYVDATYVIMNSAGDAFPMKKSVGRNSRAKIKVQGVYEDATPQNIAIIFNVDPSRVETAMAKMLGRNSNGNVNWENLLGKPGDPKVAKGILLTQEVAPIVQQARSPSPVPVPPLAPRRPVPVPPPASGAPTTPTASSSTGFSPVVSASPTRILDKMKQMLGKGMLGKGETDNEATIQIMKQRRNNCNTWTPIGNLRICLSKLYGNEVSVQYLKTKHTLKNIPMKKNITNELKEILLDIIDNKSISNTFLKSLHTKEQLVLRNILHYSGLMNKYKEVGNVLMTEEEEIKRLENLKNSLLMGNNNEAVKKEFKQMILDFANNGKISYKEVVNLLSIV